MDHQLGRLDVVEEALDHDAVRRREMAERPQRRFEVARCLERGDMIDTRDRLESGDGGRLAAGRERLLDLGPEPPHGRGELGRPCRCLTEPERCRRGRTGCVDDSDHAGLHLGDPPRVRPEEEHVASARLDGEVLVERPDRDALRIQDHAVVTGLRDRAAAGECGQPGTLPGGHPPVHRVEVQVGTASTATGHDAASCELERLSEVLVVEICERRRIGEHALELVDAHLLSRCHLRHHLLDRDVDRRARWLEDIELASLHGVEEGDALDELIASERIQPAGGDAAHRVVGSPDSLQEGGDHTGRAELADHLDRSDVDAELERCSGHECLEIACPKPCLDPTATLRREAPMVGGDHKRGIVKAIVRAAEPFGQQVGDSFRHPTCVDEDERGLVRHHVTSHSIEHLLELPAGGHRVELIVGQLDRQVESPVPDRIDDHRRRSTWLRAGEEAADDFQRTLCGREADPLEVSTMIFDKSVEPLQAHRKVRASLVSGHRMDLVDDDRRDTRQHRPTRG